MLLIFFNYAVLAATFALGKQAVQLAHPLLVIGVRMTLGGSILFGLLALRPSGQLRLRRADWPRMVKISFFHIYLAFTLEFWALQFLPSSRVNLIYSMTPFVAAILSFFLKGKLLGNRQRLALVLGGLGAWFAMGGDPGKYPYDPTLRAWAHAALFVSVLSAAYAWFDIEKMMARYPIMLINAYAMVVGGVAALVTAQCLVGHRVWTIAHPESFALYILLLIGLSNLIFYNLFGWLMRRYSLTLLTFAGLLSPSFGALYGALMGERIDGQFGFSLLILIAALALYCSDLTRYNRSNS